MSQGCFKKSKMEQNDDTNNSNNQNSNNNNNNNNNPEKNEKLSESEKRKLIQDVFRSKELTPQQKNSRVQLIMSCSSLKQIEQIEEEKKTKAAKEEKVELDKSITYNLHNQVSKIYGCKHYQRNCKIRAKCCGQLFTCRICHDENQFDHAINRFETDEMFCMLCQHLQPISRECAFCKEVMGIYFCSVCKFFDNDTNKKIYHCKQCGICRVGQRDNTFHCTVCNMCYSLAAKLNHDCRPNKFNVDCCVCHRDCFSDRGGAEALKCEHVLHRSCFTSLLKVGNFKCPLCSKSMIDMQKEWDTLDQLISVQPMPREWEKARAYVLCSDCEKKNTVPYHFLGTKCQECGSYNTRILESFDFPDVEAPSESVNLLYLSEDFKYQGNSLFKEGYYDRAWELYLKAKERLEEAKKAEGFEAIQKKINYSQVTLTGNLSACLFQTEKWEEAIQYCEEAEKLLKDSENNLPNNFDKNAFLFKILFRKIKAQKNLNQNYESDLTRLKEIDPNHSELMKLLKEGAKDEEERDEGKTEKSEGEKEESPSQEEKEDNEEVVEKQE